MATNSHERTLSANIHDLTATLRKVNDKLDAIDRAISRDVTKTVMDQGTDAAANSAYRRQEIDRDYDNNQPLQAALRQHILPNIPNPVAQSWLKSIMCTFAHNHQEFHHDRIQSWLRSEVNKLTGELASSNLDAKELLQKSEETAISIRDRWFSLQGTLASGRIAFESIRDTVINEFNDNVDNLVTNYEMRAVLTKSQETEAKNFTEKLKNNDYDMQKLSTATVRDASDRRKMLSQQISHVDRNIAGDEVDIKAGTSDLKVPHNLESDLRGQELVINMDSFMEKNASTFKVTKVYTDRVGHDIDPIEGTFFTPPSAQNKYASVPASFRNRYIAENKKLWTIIIANVAPATVRELVSPFDYGVRGEKTAQVLINDGVSLYWALLSKYRPLTDTYKSDVEDFLDRSWLLMRRYDSSVLHNLKKILGYIAEAKLLGIRTKWHKTGGKWFQLFNKKSQYAVEMAPFGKCTVDSDDSVILLEKMAQEILKVAVQEFTSADTNEGFVQMAMIAELCDPNTTLDESQDATDLWVQAMAGAIDEDEKDKRGVQVVPGNALAQARALAGSHPGRQNSRKPMQPPFRGLGANRGSGYGRGGRAARARPRAFNAEEEEEEEQFNAGSLLAAQAVPKGWDKKSGCFNQGCPGTKYKSFDFCSTCHKTGMQSGSLTGKDGKDYPIFLTESSTTQQRREALEKIQAGASKFRGEYGHLAGMLSFEDELENAAAMTAEIAKGTSMKRPRSDSVEEKDVKQEAANSAQVGGKHQRINQRFFLGPPAECELPFGSQAGDDALLANMRSIVDAENRK